MAFFIQGKDDHCEANGHRPMLQCTGSASFATILPNTPAGKRSCGLYRYTISFRTATVFINSGSCELLCRRCLVQYRQQILGYSLDFKTIKKQLPCGVGHTGDMLRRHCEEAAQER